MLSTFELVTYSVATLVLLPLAAYSLFNGSPAPQNTILSKDYAVETHLNLVGNLFLVTVCAHALVGLAQHFAVIDAATAESARFFVGVPFGIFLVAYLVLWARAALKIRRQRKAEA